MITYVFLPSLTGIVCGLFGLWVHGAGLWQILMWYLAGGWAGLALILGAVFLSGLRHSTPHTPAR